MGNYQNLKNSIAQVIKTNGNQEITGQLLQNTLNNIVNSIGANYTFAGVAEPNTNPGAPDQKVFYITGKNGTYANFGDISVNNELAVILSSENAWVKKQVYNFINNLVTEYNVSVQHPTGGTGGSNKYTLAEAIKLIPAKLRTVGIKCSFIAYKPRHKREIFEAYEWVGGEYNTSTWRKVVSIGDVKETELLTFCVSAFNNIRSIGEDISMEPDFFKMDTLLNAAGDENTFKGYKTTRFIDGVGSFDAFSAVSLDMTWFSYSHPTVCFYRTEDKSFVAGFKCAGTCTIAIPNGYSIRITLQSANNTKIIYSRTASFGRLKYIASDIEPGVIKNEHLTNGCIKAENIEDGVLPDNSLIKNTAIDVELLKKSHILLFKSMQAVSVRPSSYIWQTGEIRTNIPTIKIKVYDVSQNIKILIDGKSIGYGIMVWGFYNSLELSQASLVEPGQILFDSSSAAQIHTVVNKPDGAKYLAVCSNINYKAISVSSADSYIPKHNAFATNKVHIKNGDVEVLHKYSKDKDIRVTIGKCGVNKLPQLKKTEFIANTDMALSDMDAAAESVRNYTSDWVGPYVMTANANGNGLSGFTGGWHGSDGGAGGGKTAHNTSIQVFADKREITEDSGAVGGDVVEIIVTNLLNAGNTKQEDGNGRDVLKEVVTYTFKDSKIFVNVISKALEDLTITTYYGMQISGYTDTVSFITSSKVYTTHPSSALYVPEKVDYVIGELSSGECVKAKIDNVGLGHQKYGSKAGYAFTEFYGSKVGKTYYSLIQNPLVLKKGERITWQGYYEFFQK